MPTDLSPDVVSEREALELLKQAIATRCEPEVGVFEKDIVEFYAAKMRDFGLEVDVFEEVEGRPNVVGRARGQGGGRSVLFSAHLMCPVSALEDWHCDPYATVVEERRIYALGVADMKAAIVAMLYAARDAVARNATGDVIVALGAGGELGGAIGTGAIMRRGYRADFAIVGEPTDLDIVHCQRGAVWTEWHVKGRTGLTGAGINAVHKALSLGQEFVALNEPLQKRKHPLLGHGQLSINVIRGGTETYNVPDHCLLKVDRRLVPPETTDDVIGQLDAAADRMRAKDPELDVNRDVTLHIPTVETDPQFSLVQELAAGIADVKGAPPEFKGIRGFTEMVHIHEAGVPAVVCGPGSVKVIHAPNEWVAVDEFMNAIQIYTNVSRRITSLPSDRDLHQSGHLV
jgi:acetylornithine deacetylase/succinyl-diaminopimelate desuccinylase-like protein